MRTITVMIINNGGDDDDNDDGSLKASLIWHLFRSAALNHHALTDMSCARWLISHRFVHLSFIMFMLNILRTSCLFIENLICYFFVHGYSSLRWTWVALMDIKGGHRRIFPHVTVNLKKKGLLWTHLKVNNLTVDCTSQINVQVFSSLLWF